MRRCRMLRFEQRAVSIGTNCWNNAEEGNDGQVESSSEPLAVGDEHHSSDEQEQGDERVGRYADRRSPESVPTVRGHSSPR